MDPTYRELLAQSRDAFNDRDPEAWIEAWNPDCEWHPFLTAREEGDPGYHGRNGVRAWFEDVDEMFSEIHVDLEPVPRDRRPAARPRRDGGALPRDRRTGQPRRSPGSWSPAARGCSAAGPTAATPRASARRARRRG